jgi:hypothetical protein
LAIWRFMSLVGGITSPLVFLRRQIGQKRTGVARAPLRRGEKLSDKIEAQLSAIKCTPRLVRSFFQAPTVAYITDW